MKMRQIEQAGNIQVKETRFEQIVKRAYGRFIFPWVRQELHRQRIKLSWFIWDYWPILILKNIPFLDRMKLLKRFLAIDWNIVHAHLPSEIAIMCAGLATRKAKFDEVVVEAGCWNGGSAAKLSVICKMLGYRLMVYDSFAGVETPPLDQQEREDKSFFGEYAATDTIVLDNLVKYGESEVCHLVRGWFRDTLARVPVPHPVRLAYIDCDLAKGTEEALTGLIPSLVDDGYIFSEDYHIQPVHDLLSKPGSLERFRKGPLQVTALGRKLAVIRFKPKV
jgi:hypothetical protein